MMQRKDVCPVCGMLAESEVPSVEDYKIYYHFCSAQCRQTFIARPSLYRLKLENSRSEVLKRRTMNLAEPLGKAGAELLTPRLMALMGVKEALIAGDKIHITYNLLEVTEKQIEEVLLEVGLVLGDGWLANFRRGWIHDSEENELDNLAAPPPSSYTHISPKKY